MMEGGEGSSFSPPEFALQATSLSKGGGASQATPDQPMQLWSVIGTENFHCNHPEHSIPGRDDADLHYDIWAGTEAEWESLLASDDTSRSSMAKIKVMLFLRSLYVPNDPETWRQYANQRGHAAQYGGGHGDNVRAESRTLSRVPTEEEKMNLAKALFLGEGGSLRGLRNSIMEGWLLDRFIQEMQPQVIEHMGELSTTQSFDPERITNLAHMGPLRAVSMVASASRTMIQGVGRFIASYTESGQKAVDERMQAGYNIRNSGDLVRGCLETIAAVQRSQRSQAESIIDTVMGAIPGIPDLDDLSEIFFDNVKSGITNALKSLIGEGIDVDECKRNLINTLYANVDNPLLYQRLDIEANREEITRELHQTVRSVLN